MKGCNLCQREKVKEILDLGEQPVCHRFLFSPKEKEYKHPVTIGQCLDCGMVQLMEPMSIDELKPRFDWLECTEPERHLDRLVQKLTQLPGITKDSNICGISFKEDSTLGRFNRLGYCNTWRIDPNTELGISDPLSSVETVVNLFTPERAAILAEKHGKFDICIARHLIEHAMDIRQFMEAVKCLIRSNGYVVFEIPDCERALSKCDYTTYWEEHTVYFTPATFQSCFGFGGFELVSFIREEYPLEDSYIGIAQPKVGIKEPFPPEDVIKVEIDQVQRFSSQLQGTRKKYNNFLKAYKQEHGKIAIFGAAHMCCTFINVLNIKDHIDFVVDDNPHKRGMFMPGSHLPIYESQFILDKGIKLCLLTVSPAGEEKVLEKNQEFIKRGGAFKSIFPGNPMALII